MKFIRKTVQIIKEAWKETINPQRTENDELEEPKSANQDNLDELEWTVDNNSDDLEFGDHHVA